MIFLNRIQTGEKLAKTIQLNPLADEEAIRYLSGSASTGKQQLESLPAPRSFVSAFPVSRSISCI